MQNKASKGQLLDIGAGTGDFYVVGNNGWNTMGIRPSEKLKL